jgi:cell division protein FtsB
MQTKNLTKKANDFIMRLSDLRFAGQVLFVIIVLLMSWSGIKTIQTNYGLQKQISGLKQQNDVQRLQNNNLELTNTYLNSNQYLELAARQNFGLAAPGEKELIVPESVALAYTTNVPTGDVETAADKQPAYQRHFSSWVDFFLNRQGDN